MVQADRDATAVLGEGLDPFIGQTVAVDGDVRDHVRVVFVVPTVVEHLHEVRTGVHVTDTESDLGQGLRHLVEDVLEVLEGHVFTLRGVRLVAVLARTLIGTGTDSAHLEVEDLRTKLREGGIISQRSSPAHEFASGGIETEVVVRRLESLDHRSAFKEITKKLQSRATIPTVAKKENCQVETERFGLRSSHWSGRIVPLHLQQSWSFG